MQNKINDIVFPVIQIIGVIFFNWNLNTVITLYVMQMFVIGILSMIGGLIPFRQNQKNVSDIIIELVIGVGNSFMLVIFYFFMVILGSLLILGSLVNFKVGVELDLNLLRDWPLLAVVLPMIINEIVIAVKTYQLFYSRHINSIDRIMRPYIEEGIFLTAIIVFFIVSILTYLITRQENINFTSVMAIAFVIVRTSADIVIGNIFERNKIFASARKPLKSR